MDKEGKMMYATIRRYEEVNARIQENKKKYHYVLINQHASSEKYGNCEVCGEHVSEVYSQKDPSTQIITFGHKECLLYLRK